MSEFGFQVDGNLGQKQIDSNYMNFTVLQKGSVTIKEQYEYIKTLIPNFFSGTSTYINTSCWGNDYSQYFCGFVDIPNPSSTVPLVAIKTPVDDLSYGFHRALDTNGDGKYDKLEFIGYDNNLNSQGTSGGVGKVLGTIDYIIFARPDDMTESTDNYGLRVYDSSSKLVFDSGEEHLLIRNSTVITEYQENETAPSSVNLNPENQDNYFIVTPFVWSQEAIQRTCYSSYYFYWNLYFLGILNSSDGNTYMFTSKYARLVYTNSIDTYAWMGAPPTVIETTTTGE